MSTMVGLADRVGLAPLLAEDRLGLIGEADRHFRRVLLRTGLPMLLFALAVPWLQFERQQPVPKPLPLALLRVELLAEPVPRLSPPPVIAKSLPQAAKPVASLATPAAATATPDARQQAAAAGLLQMRAQLAAIGDRSLVAVDQPQDLITAVRNGSSGPVGAGLAAAASSGTAEGTAPRAVAGQGSAAELGARRTGQVQGGIDAGSGAGTAPGSGAGGRGGRSLEEIQLGFDRGKAGLNAIFSRAARETVGMGAGRIMLSLTIAPDGSVTRCELVSSSFANPALEQKLLARIRQMNFGPRDVPPFTVMTYPLDYLPG